MTNILKFNEGDVITTILRTVTYKVKSKGKRIVLCTDLDTKKDVTINSETHLPCYYKIKKDA